MRLAALLGLHAYDIEMREVACHGCLSRQTYEIPEVASKRTVHASQANRPDVIQFIGKQLDYPIKGKCDFFRLRGSWGVLA